MTTFRFFKNLILSGWHGIVFEAMSSLHVTKTWPRRRCHATRIRVILILLSITISAFADTVHLRSADSSIRQVKIISFRQARVEAIDTKTGQRRFIDFGEIALVRVDGQPELNEAEKWGTAKQYDQAAGAYQKALKKSSGKGSWIPVWTKARLMNLYAALGQADRMVEMYVDLARQIPDWVIQVAPARKDIKVSDSQLELAARNLLQARDESGSGKVREALGKFYQRLNRDRKLPPAKDTKAMGLAETDLEKFDQPGPWLDSWAEEKIKSGSADSVLRVTQRLYFSSLRRNLPAVFYWQGRGHAAKGEYDLAALDLLETAIEFPSSSYAPPALFWAARAAAETGRYDYARKLRLELIDNFSGSNDYTVIQLVEKARDFLHEKE